MSFKAPKTLRWAERPVASSLHSLAGGGAQFLPGRLGSILIFFRQQVPAAAGPCSTWSRHTGCSLGSMPTLLWGLELLAAPPQGPGCQILVPLLKGLEQGGGGEVLQLPPGLCCLCPAPSVPWGIEVPPSALGGQAANPAPRPNAEAQNRADL